MGVVTLITDFGTRDHYVGAMKGVILGIAPDVRIIDITHDIQPHDVQQAAFVLRQIWSWYPPETIHLAVVDPGVGSARRIILGRYAGRYVVAPDNGLITLVHREMPPESMRVVENRRYFGAALSATFHARDIMAPVASHLASGVDPEELGPVTDRLELLPIAHRAESAGDRLIGRVLYVDRFGTMVTNIHREQLARKHRLGEWEVLVNGAPIGSIANTFSDVAVGEPVVLVGSADLLEIAVNQGSAVDRFGPAESIQVLAR